MTENNLPRRAVAESLGTAFLPATIVGSGIMAELLAGGNAAIALILTFGTISGAHFNPAVTIAGALMKGIGWRACCVYTIAQMVGAIVGTAANVMFELPVFFASQKGKNRHGAVVNFQLRKGQLQTQFGGNYQINRKTTLDFRFINGRFAASPRSGFQIGFSRDF